MEIYLENSIFLNKELSDKAIAAYVALRQQQRREVPVECISCARLVYELNNDAKYNKSAIDAIDEGIHELQNHGRIQILDSIGTKKQPEYVLDLSKLYLNTQENYYLKVDYNAMGWIMGRYIDTKEAPFYLYPDPDDPENIDKNGTVQIREPIDMSVPINQEEMTFAKRMGLLRYYLCMISTFDDGEEWEEEYKGKIGHMPISYLADIANISSKTAIRYNKILEDLRLMYFKRTNNKVLTREGEIKQIGNFYCFLENRELCEKFSEQSTMHWILQIGGKVLYSLKNVKEVTQDREIIQKINTVIRDLEKNRKEFRYDAETCDRMIKYLDAYHLTLKKVRQDAKNYSKKPDIQKDIIKECDEKEAWLFDKLKIYNYLKEIREELS